MKKTILLAILAFAISANGLLHAGRLQQVNEQLAVHAVKSYFDALLVGDTAGVQQILGRDLLKERSGMLNNPTYGSFLHGLYANATYKIIEVTRVDDSAVGIKVHLDFGDGNSQQNYLLLDKDTDSHQYKIISEK